MRSRTDCMLLLKQARFLYCRIVFDLIYGVNLFTIIGLYLRTHFILKKNHFFKLHLYFKSILISSWSSSSSFAKNVFQFRRFKVWIFGDLLFNWIILTRTVACIIRLKLFCELYFHMVPQHMEHVEGQISEAPMWIKHWGRILFVHLHMFTYKSDAVSANII